MPFYTDQLGRTIELKELPQRIISLVPSQTEFLFDIGLDQQVIGITKFCIHPDEAIRTRRTVGGTKTINIEIIRELKPQLIIANKEENTREQIELLSLEFPVWISDISTLQDAMDMMRSIGNICQRQSEALHIILKIEKGFESLKLTESSTALRASYLIWRKPYMVAGGNTFIHHMLLACGITNVFQPIARYPELTIEQLREANCELLLLSSEPYPFRQKHLDELQYLLPGTKILLVDGEMFSWYGSRLQYSPYYFAELLEKARNL